MEASDTGRRIGHEAIDVVEEVGGEVRTIEAGKRRALKVMVDV